jgi:hypothetical protein
VAGKAEAASPLTGKNSKITTLPMCKGQRQVKSLHKIIISITSKILAQSKEYKSKKIVEPMMASKEPDHSLGGYSHQERWSRTR